MIPYAALTELKTGHAEAIIAAAINDNELFAQPAAASLAGTGGKVTSKPPAAQQLGLSVAPKPSDLQG